MNSKGKPEPVGVEESIRWARELVLRKRPKFGSDLARALDYGSRAVVAVLDWNEDRAEMYARLAGHYAIKAVRSLRE